MLKSPKHVFWEALLLTIVVFIFGLLIGVAFEGNRLDKINEYYAVSEISLMDILALNDIMSLGNLSCQGMIDSNLNFADRIYNEAQEVERYDAAGKITEGLKLAHKKYDLMRTFLWANAIRTSETCASKVDFNIIVYLYEYESRDLTKKATQNVWSKILFDLKEEYGSDIVLIPIAVDADLSSLNAIVSEYNIESYPVVIINNEHVVQELSSVKDLSKYLE